MKKLFLALTILTLLAASGAYADLRLYEGFDYDAGALTTITSNWTMHSGTAGQITILDTASDSGKSLSYTGIAAPAGRRIDFSQSLGEDAGRNFTAITDSGNSAYASFFLKMTTVPSSTTGSYFAHLFQGNSGTFFVGRIFARQSTTSGKFNLGITRASNTSSSWSGDLDLDTTYFICLKYTMNTSPTADVAYLWINPDSATFEGTEPSTTLTSTDTGNITASTGIARFAVRQAAAIGIGEIDEIRVGTTWADITEKPSAPASINATVSPASFTYGPIAQGATLDKIFTVKADATNTADLDISSPGLEITGDDSAKFSIVSAPSLPISLAPDAETTFTIRYTPGNINHANHSAVATLVSNDDTDPTIDLTGKTYWEVADINEAKGYSVTSGTLQITGTVIVTSKTNGLNAGRNQLYVQDNSGADGQTGILIDDSGYKLAKDYSEGDRISKLTGTISVFNGVQQFAPSIPAIDETPGTVPEPIIVDAGKNFEEYESELIRINVASVSATGDWTANSNYTLTTPAHTITLIRIEDFCTAATNAIPTGNFDIIGIAAQFNTTYQIFPRFDTDIITPASSVQDWALINK